MEMWTDETRSTQATVHKKDVTEEKNNLSFKIPMPTTQNQGTTEDMISTRELLLHLFLQKVNK